MIGDEFIGRGWRFPIRVNQRGGLDWSEGPDRVRDAIWLVLNTGVGERVMRPTFGAGVQDYVFKPNSAATRVALAQAIREALVRWEPRIEIEGVRVDAAVGGETVTRTDVADQVASESSQVLVFIEYRLRATNELFNLVYPFYLQEGVR